MTCMNIIPSLRIAFLSLILFSLAACTVDKLEARLQADPKCQSVMNPKTGALMPCASSDTEFYRSVGLMTPAPAPKVNVTEGVVASTQSAGSPDQKTAGNPLPSPKPALAPVECKPQLHQKSGSLIPCPAP
jgi:hypothetical protein